MEEIKSVMQPYIGVSIFTYWGNVGTGQNKILIWDRQELVEIGEYPYSIISGGLTNEKWVHDWLIQLAEAAEKYRAHRNGSVPKLFFNKRYLTLAL